VSFFSSVNIIMADMYTPEEINEIFAAYNEAVQKGIPISKELAQQMKDATLGVKNYTQQLQNSLKQLGTSFKTLGADIAKGEKGASVFNNVLSSGGDAIADYTAKFNPAVRALGLFTKATMAYVGAVNKQADALYKSYQDISRAGVVGAGGMKEVYTNMQRFGYTINELGEFGALMKSNSEVLAKFGGTAFNGAEQFANLADQIQNSQIGRNLMLMGVSVDEINKGAAGFVKQQTNLGRNAAGMQKTLATETAKYLENLEAVSRLTGQDRATLQQKQEDAQAEQQFAAKQFELKQRALAGDMEAAKELRKLEALNETLSGDMRLDVIRSFAGDVAASGRLMTAMPGVFQKMQDATADEADVIFEMTKGSRRNITDMNKAFQLGFGADTFYAFKDNAQLVSQFGDALNPAQIRAMMEAAKKNATTTDEATKNQVDLEKAQRRASNNLQDFLNLGINPVTKGMKILANAIEYLTDLIPGAGRARRNAAEAELNSQGKTSARQDQVSAVASGSTMGDLGTAQLTQAERGMGGLKLKSSESIAGGDSSETLVALAYQIQEALGGDLKYFSGLNDTGRTGNSKHKAGRAIDIVLNDPEKYASTLAMIKGMSGVSFAQFERAGQVNANGSVASGDHIHAEVSAASGAILSGPNSGYRPNLTMHGTEAVVPLPDGRSIPVSGSSESSSLMAAQLDKLDELVNVMKSQLSVSNKLLSYSS
jgi:hypothetical protein